MTNEKTFTLSQRLIIKIIDSMTGLNKRRKEFMVHILLQYWSLRGRYTFLNQARYGHYHEWTYRQQFEKSFDWLSFNVTLIKEHGAEPCIIAFDPSYLPKSGKHTPGLGKFWNGCAQAAKLGLEIGSLAVVNVDQPVAFSLEAIQTPSLPHLQLADKTLTDHYATVIIERKDRLKEVADHLVCDGWFAKKKFIDAIAEQTDLHLVSKLRSDADLYYLYRGPRTGRRGRPKLYDGKVTLKQIDTTYFVLEQQDAEQRIYSAKVYAKGFKRIIKVAYVERLDKQNGAVNSRKLLFSTDFELSGLTIYRYYRVRFQPRGGPQEFLFRDAKQFTGLTHCQARSKQKLTFHVNASLSSVSLAKIAYQRKEQPFSMANVKTLSGNQFMLKRIFSILAIDPETIKNNPAIRQLETMGLIAA